MAGRLGDVIYWIGCLFAFIILGLSVAGWLFEGSRADGLLTVGAYALIAAIFFFLARAARYILAGR